MFEMLARGLLTGLSIGAVTVALLAFFLASACVVLVIRTAFKKKGRKKNFFKKWWKKALKKAGEIVVTRPTLPVEFLAVTGGWLFLLFIIFILLSPLWQWFLAHPAFFWMPLAVFIAVRILYASGKKPAQFLAFALAAVFAIATIYLVASWDEVSSRKNGPVHESMAAERPVAPTPPARERWQNCIAIPVNTSKKASVLTLSAPADRESLCYLIRDGYWFRITPKTKGTLVRIIWQNGRVVDLAEETTHMKPLGNSIRDAAFVMMSIGDKPAAVIVRLEKK